ncbi:hypothetical protein ACIBEJ_09310 [Nonomuraea sp. NPDC050790]|uniref:hypothetical protein n=1 Tax=Nonomuraea sp. NPDC050790 TaxID=3364371 RepID=UPI00379F115F
MGSRVTTADKPQNASPPRRSRIGDLRMRDVYRGLAVLAAVAVAAVAVVLALPSRPDEVADRPVAAPSTAPPTSSATLDAAAGPTGGTAQPSGVAQPAGTAAPVVTASAAVSATASPTVSATASPSVSPSASPTVSAAVPAVPSAAPSVSQAAARPTPSPGASLAPGYTAMEAFYADSRLPEVPAKPKKATLPKPGRHVIADKRSGVAVPRLGSPWKRHRGAPYSTKQVLPKLRGRAERGLVVSCPVPIEAQKEPRDTALLAARWTLNHHPKGATVRWMTSQPVKGGWAMIYQVKYGKRSSMAAVVVLDGGMAKPGLVFASIPDTQRKRWRDIYRVVSGARVLG